MLLSSNVVLGGIPVYIYRDIGGLDRWVWFILAYLLCLAAVCPFVGSISDLIGRRYVALVGSLMLVVAMVVCSTAKAMNTFIGGMSIAGVGAGICELTALAATSELAPTRQRGKYVAVLVSTLLPFCPSVLYGQLIASNAGWRYCGVLCGVWAGVGLFATLFFYFPPPRENSRGLTRKQILAEIDWLGGLLSVSGMILFMAGLQWGGYQVSLAVTALNAGADKKSVSLGLCPCPCSPPLRCRSTRRFLRLGILRSQIPNVPSPPETRTSNPRPHPHHHLHLRRKPGFRRHVLAVSSLPRLRP